MKLPALLAGLLLPYAATEGINYKFTEEMDIKSFENGKVLVKMQFVQSQNLDSVISEWNDCDFKGFPRSIGQLVQGLGIGEFHFTLVQGRPGKEHFLSNSPGGASFSVWINNKHSIVESWNRLTNILSGQFCSSTNFMVDAVTATPTWSFRPEGQINTEDHVLRYSVLPREVVCTENLTPWIKLLPCKDKCGLAAFLNPNKIFDADYNAIGTHLTAHCLDKDCKMHQVRLTQTIELLMDPVRSNAVFDWTLNSLFDRNFQSSCTLSSSTRLRLFVSSKNLLKLQPSQWEDYEGHKVAVYSDTKDFGDIGLKDADRAKPRLSPILVDRYLVGSGQETGHLVTTFDNAASSKDINLVYYEILPWYLRLYLSSAEVKIFKDSAVSKFSFSEYFKDWIYTVAVDRTRPASLEVKILVPARSKMLISFEFERAYLKYTEYPFDANRGLDIPSAIVNVLDRCGNFILQNGLHSPSSLSNSNKPDYPTPMRLTTPTILLSMPLPDFTMPYNVITLSCTVIALFYGSIFNMFFRRFSVNPSSSIKSKLGNLVLRLLKNPNSPE